MLSKFLNHLEIQNINPEGKRFLLAVSGGKDSMFMLHAFIQSKLDVGVAHINHKLRGEASDKEENLVKTICEKEGISVYVKQLDTSIFENTNLQAMAREERYSFLREIVSRQNYDYICTAHHLDDRLETFMLNLVRGSGLRGLSSIQSDGGIVLRPLLRYTSHEIEDYVESKGIPYLEDASNQETKYNRNYLRHEVLSALKKQFPSYANGVEATMDNLRNSQILLIDFVKRWKEEHCIENEKGFKVSILALKENPGKETLLYELLRDFGYSRMQIKEILSGLENVGNMYFSPDYKLLVDREYLLLSDRITNPELGQLELNDILTNERSTNPYIEVIDKSKARYGFSLRVPEPGTRMQPLGMNGRSKKISDILIDKKINRFDKEKIQLLYCGDTPVWLIGITLDERFKTDSETTKYLQLTYSTK